MENLWSHDASRLKMDDIRDDYIYKNQTIEEYLKPTSHERKLFLIGAKGCGKTLLLRYKAYLYWNKLSKTGDEQASSVSGSNELIESLDFSIETLSENELFNLANLQKWKSIWKFSISLVALRRLGIALPEKLKHLDKDFPPFFALSNIITELITNQGKYITSNFFKDNLNLLSALLNSVNSTFVLFIDRLDQALDDLLSNEEYKYLVSEKKEENIPFKVWQYAQCGLLLTGYNFTTANNRHIKIFATARREALEVNTQLMANVSGFCTYLEYTKDELKEIFEKNIKYTPKKYLSPDVDSSNPYLSFFGFENMSHVRAKDESQEYRKEHVFDFLLRHTFERPREVVMIGRKIFSQILSREYHSLSLEKKIEKVRREVNNTSHKTILNNYIKEIVPAFHEEYIDECARKFEQNLIYREELEKIDSSIMNYLYRIGLIGYVRQGKQIFLPASKHIHDYRERLPVSTNYVLHPSLDRRLQQERDFNEFYNDSCIIGNGYPFYVSAMYPGTRKMIKKVEYYMPKVLPGKNGLEERWRRVNIQVDARGLFRALFIEEKYPRLAVANQKLINNALDMLTNIANQTAIRLLSKEFSDLPGSWTKWSEELENRLHSFYEKFEYSHQIRAIDEENLHFFAARIFGRIIAAGMLVYLDTDYYNVRSVLRTFCFNRPQNSEGEEGAVRFLRQAFFLAHLPNTTPGLRNDRLMLLNSLSNFEQTLLRRWWLQYREHVIFQKAYFSKEHIDYLNKIMSPSIFRA